MPAHRPSAPNNAPLHPGAFLYRFFSDTGHRCSSGQYVTVSDLFFLHQISPAVNYNRCAATRQIIFLRYKLRFR